MLLALEVRKDLFNTLEEILDTRKRKRAFIEVKTNRTQSKIAEEADIDQSTISRMLSELIELGLVREVDEGYEKTLGCIDHPILEHLWNKEVLN